MLSMFFLFFFFKQKTAYEMRISDWSSDVCSSDLLRDAGLQVIVHAGSAGFKSQFKRADASGAQLAVILGADELASQTASVKWLRERAGDDKPQQEAIPLDRLVTELKLKV